MIRNTLLLDGEITFIDTDSADDTVMKHIDYDDDEVEPGTGVGPANLSLPNETTKCDPQLRSGLASSSQETNFSETLIPSLSAGQGRIFFSLFKCAN